MVGMRRVLLVAGVLGVGGCVSPSSSDEVPEAKPITAAELASRWVDPGPFAPVRVRVYPLTRLDAGTGDGPVLIVHLEVTDRWRDNTKFLGRVTVEVTGLDGPGGGETARWDLDVWEAELSSRYYDPPTQTYRVVLGELPGWLGRVGAEGGRVALSVRVATSGADGGMVELSDESELEGG